MRTCDENLTRRDNSASFRADPRDPYNTPFAPMTQAQAKTRRQKLEEFVAANPGDAFARYGLALECSNSGDSAAAAGHFEQLLRDHPEYVAGYLMYGQLLAKIGDSGKARSVLSTGMDVARRAGDDHARSEMESALAGLA